MSFRATIWLFLLFGIQQLCAQVAADCGNAVPICNNTPVNGGTNNYGIDDFNGAAASGCLEQTLTGAIESNSAWYRFRTGASGQLGFNIGIDATEDWDFALYRSGDCNNLGDPVRCNFFDNGDANTFIGVGEDPTGDPDNVQYEDWLDVVPGEDFYLLINNFSNINSGFSIQFSGQIFVTNPYDALDCSIINNLLGPPVSACDGDIVVLDANTIGALTYNWFEDMGSGFLPISGQHNATLSVTTSASYRVEVVMPSGNNIISDVQVAFSVVPTTNPVSHIASCSDVTLFDLSQKDSEALGSQSPTEFLISYYTNLTDAQQGINFLPVQYMANIGTQTIYVRTTSLTNPNCFDTSQQFDLTIVEAPTLDFPEDEFICQDAGSLIIGDTMNNSGYSYAWDSGETTSTISISQAGTYNLTATNTQAGISCTSSRTVTVVVSTPPIITNVIIEDLQQNNKVTLEIDREGDFEYWLDDGSAQNSNVFNNVTPGTHTVTVYDPMGCGSATENIVVVGFPKFFTPNGDGLNDNWNIEGISSLQNPVVFIFDRFGKLLAQLNDQSAWNGTMNGRPLPSTDYWFKLTYLDIEGERTTAKYINNHFSLKR